MNRLVNNPYYIQLTKECGNCYEIMAKMESPDDIGEKLSCDQGCGPDGKYNYKVKDMVFLLELRKKKEGE